MVLEDVNVFDQYARAVVVVQGGAWRLVDYIYGGVKYSMCVNVATTVTAARRGPA